MKRKSAIKIGLIIITFLMLTYKNVMALILASFNGDLEVVEYLIKIGFNFASIYEIKKVLIEAGTTHDLGTDRNP